MTAPPLITYRQVAEMLAVSETTVIRMANAGDIHPVRLPKGGTRFRRSDIEAIINQETPTP